MTADIVSSGAGKQANSSIYCKLIDMSLTAFNLIRRFQSCKKNFSLISYTIKLTLFGFRATSGIDYNVKIWTPSEEESVYDEKQASDVRLDIVWI